MENNANTKEIMAYIGYCGRCGSGVKTGGEAIRNWKGRIVRCTKCIGKTEVEIKEMAVKNGL